MCVQVVLVEVPVHPNIARIPIVGVGLDIKTAKVPTEAAAKDRLIAFLPGRLRPLLDINPWSFPKATILPRIMMTRKKVEI